MTRADRSKALAMDILRVCIDFSPSEIRTALTLATAQMAIDTSRKGATIDDLVLLHADTLRQTLTWMMEEPPAAGRLQ